MQMLKSLSLSRARSAMKSIIFDLSVSRQHGELLQGLQAADMLLSAKKIFRLFWNPLRFVDVIPAGFFLF